MQIPACVTAWLHEYEPWSGTIMNVPISEFDKDDLLRIMSFMQEETERAKSDGERHLKMLSAVSSYWSSNEKPNEG